MYSTEIDTKFLCILVSAPLFTYLDQFSAELQKMPFLDDILNQLILLLMPYLKINSRTAPSNNAIFDEFSEQHQQQSIKKAPDLMTDIALFQSN